MPTHRHVGELPIVSPDRSLAGRPSPRIAVRMVAVMATAGVLLAGCRSDSFTSPQSADCTGEPGCRTSLSIPVDPAVHASLDDASLRLAPVIGDAVTHRALASDLRALSQALRDGRASDARAALADVYVQLAPFRVTRPDGTTMDPPDVAALRLELVPAANALGVQVK